MRWHSSSSSSRRAASSLPRRVGRVCAYALCAHVSVAALLAAASRLCDDDFFDAHWCCSEPVVAPRRHAGVLAPWWWWWWRWPWSPHLATLRADERRCLQHWLDCLSLRRSPADALSRRVMWHDTLLLLDGVDEVCDATAVVRRCVHRITPVVLALRREDAGAVTYLHSKLDVHVTWRVPLLHHLLGSNNVSNNTKTTNADGDRDTDATMTRLVPCFCVGVHVPLTVTLQLERVAPDEDTSSGGDGGRAPLVITGVEQRWFGGLLCSRQAGSLSSPLGDVGDLHRRLSAFVLTRCTAHARRIAATAAAVHATADA